MISLLRFHAALGPHALGRNPAIQSSARASRCLVALFSRGDFTEHGKRKIMLQRSRNPSEWLT
jgi:hypothetical protein